MCQAERAVSKEEKEWKGGDWVKQVFYLAPALAWGRGVAGEARDGEGVLAAESQAGTPSPSALHPPLPHFHGGEVKTIEMLSTFRCLEEKP